MNSTDLRQVFGANLRLIRENKGLSQGELASMAGVNRSYLNRLEHGTNCAGLGIIAKLAGVLGCGTCRYAEMAVRRAASLSAACGSMTKSKPHCCRSSGVVLSRSQRRPRRKLPRGAIKSARRRCELSAPLAMRPTGCSANMMRPIPPIAWWRRNLEARWNPGATAGRSGRGEDPRARRDDNAASAVALARGAGRQSEHVWSASTTAILPISNCRLEADNW
jgi:DNA-binding XRE family transcriptional regulator